MSTPWKSYLASIASITMVVTTSACRTTAGGSAVKVVDGTPVAPGSNYAQSTVGLTGEKPGNIGCTGTLVVDRLHVVTAMHCIQPLIQKSSDGPSAVGVVKGKDRTINVTFGLSRISPDHAIPAHFQLYDGAVEADNLFTDAGASDIALLTLDSPAPDGAVPVLLLPRTATLTTGDQVTTVGYGITDSNDHDYATAGILRSGPLSITAIDHSAKRIVVEGIAAACHGDSGGPSYITRDGQMYLAGITSSGDNGCHHMNALDARLFDEWVLQAIAGSTKPTAPFFPPSFWQDPQHLDQVYPYCHKSIDHSANNFFSTGEPELNGPGGKCRSQGD